MVSVLSNKYIAPVVSIIIPVYNTEKYIEKCIGSVLSQDFNGFELIAVDDGSTDHSGEICENMASLDKRIRVIHIQNGGVSNARNTGILAAKGQYIQFVDSDDFIDQSYVRSLYEILNGSQLSIGAINVYNKNTVRIADLSVADSALDFENLNKDLFIELIEKFLLFGPFNKLYRAEIIKDNNIKFDTSLSYGEDMLFNFSYLKYVKNIAITNKAAYNYMWANEGSLATKYRPDMAVTAKKVHFALIDFFASKDFTEPRLPGIIYGRLFDNFYNTMLSVNNKKCSLSLRQKCKYIKSLMEDEEFKKCFKYLKKNKYSKPIIWLMKNKQAALLVLYIYISRVKRIALK